ncbi:MAG: hypothetical protein HY273_02240 [Gammaproteobacteria bacterium]|nr:hypothetical protein [Gammaproteobacteria bacterium]
MASLRRCLALAILLTTLLLNACLVRVAYNNADWLLIWKLDSAFDLTSPQKDFLGAHLREQLRWHRTHELANAITFLQRTQAAAADGLTQGELEDTVAALTTLRNTLSDRLAADSAEFFAQVSDDQLEYLQKSLNKANKDWEKRANLPPNKRSAERTERILGIVTDWIGSLSGAQEKQLTQSIEHLPDVLEIWLDHTKQRQQQFVEIVRSARTDRTDASHAFVAWITAEAMPPELKIHRAAVYELILEIDKLCTPKQHEYFNRKLQGWIDDLQLALTQGAT